MEQPGNDEQRSAIGVIPRPASAPTVSLQPALERIAELAALPVNWDGDGATPPTARAVAAAYLLIEAVAEAHEHATGAHRAPWTSAPIPDGGLQVEWLGSGVRIDVQVAPDGTVGYMIKLGSGASAAHEEADDADFDTVLGRVARVLRTERSITRHLVG